MGSQSAGANDYVWISWEFQNGMICTSEESDILKVSTFIIVSGRVYNNACIYASRLSLRLWSSQKHL